MTSSRTGGRALAAACALVLFVAACGGDDDSAETTDASTTVAESTTTADDETATTAAEDEPDDEPAEEAEPDADEPNEDDDEPDEDEEPADGEDQALAEAVTLTEDDFSAEWTATEDDDDGDDELGDCFTDPELDTVQEAEFNSPNFSQEAEANLIAVSSVGLVVSDAESAEALLDEALTNRWAGCALDQLVAGFEESGGSVLDSDLVPAPDVGEVAEQSAVLNGFFSVDAGSGTTLEGEVSLRFIRTAEVITGIAVLAYGDTEFAAIVDQVTTIVGDKHVAEVD
ncbi:hypothetical protein [Iamia sp.]|uniref:hypothetical protein n=1 Tax=Iamia sp. TaxID=2722710 RepID=UPI002C8EA347|nr:hypothetical protein [Iamia sp.]HXH58839.1 hypothetical protein [Iamia sp.]